MSFMVGYLFRIDRLVLFFGANMDTIISNQGTYMHLQYKLQSDW